MDRHGQSGSFLSRTAVCGDGWGGRERQMDHPSNPGVTWWEPNVPFTRPFLRSECPLSKPLSPEKSDIALLCPVGRDTQPDSWGLALLSPAPSQGQFLKKHVHTYSSPKWLSSDEALSSIKILIPAVTQILLMSVIITQNFTKMTPTWSPVASHHPSIVHFLGDLAPQPSGENSRRWGPCLSLLHHTSKSRLLHGV